MTRNPLPGRSRPAVSRRFDRIAVVALVLGAAILSAKGWLDANPQHNPWAPLDLRDPPGLATRAKLAAIMEDTLACRSVLKRSEIPYRVLEPAGEGSCTRADRTVLSDYPLSPDRPPTTCAMAAAMELWLERSVRPAAEEILKSPLARIEHLGAYSCRRLYGRGEGPWSEHATGNALDVAGFVLSDGRRVSVLADWRGDDADAAFLRRVRDAACEVFGTVLSPDYNAAHRDHFHLDQADRGFGRVCR